MDDYTKERINTLLDDIMTYLESQCRHNEIADPYVVQLDVDAIRANIK